MQPHGTPMSVRRADSSGAPVVAERLRILHVVLSRGFAGSERAAAELCNALSKRHDVALVVRRDHRAPHGASIVDYVLPDVRIIELPARWQTSDRLAGIVRDWQPDVVHTHLRRGTRYVARLAPAAAHVCSLHLSINGPHYLYADGILCISEWQLATIPPDYPGTVYLVPNSLERHPRLDPGRVRALRASFGVGEADFLVGGVGRLVASKGFDVLVQAFERAALPNARLVIAGDGRQRGRLARLANDRTTFTGFRHDVKDLYQAFDVFVCPSNYEPFGRVIIEALDAGTPVIASDADGPRDIARRYPIELFPRGDVERLAAALRVTAARGRVRLEADLSEFELSSVVERTETAYREVLALKHGTGYPGVAAVRAPVRLQAPPGPPRYLFSPVSGPGGAGELMRCLIIARELRRAEPSADIRFLVSRTAVFRESVDFPVIDTDASPTNSTRQVLAAIAAFHPEVMVFDNSGRTSQLRAAKQAGAMLVFSSRAPKLRWKAFRLKWMRLLDEHWIVFPTFVTGGLTRIEKFKMGFFPHYRVRHLDTLFTPSEPGERAGWLAGRGLQPDDYVVFSPSGRGEGHLVADPAELFIAAARRFVERTGATAVVLTGRSEVSSTDGPAALQLLPRVGPDEVQHLLAGCRMVVCNGGTTLVHSLAHGRPIVAVPLAGDQGRRIRRAARRGIAIEAPRDAGAIADTATGLHGDAALLARMRQAVEDMGIANGVGEAVAALRMLAGVSRGRAA
jgi:glycosyltransferase involved in cell wall biosynthesis/UDP:flavonoid glycosyltransferase YjiC (YdhE family)